MQLLLGDPESAERAEVFRVLHQLCMGERRRDAFERIDGEPFDEPVARLCVEAVDGVDDHGYASKTTGDAAVDPGLGVVRVKDVGPERSQQAVDLPSRSCIAQ